MHLQFILHKTTDLNLEILYNWISVASLVF